MAAPEVASAGAGTLIASQQELEAFASQPGAGNGLSDGLRGVLAETALTGCIRYDWELLKPLCHVLIDSVLGEFAAEEQGEGPPRPMPGGGSLEEARGGLHALLDSFAEAPFTVQRLCEVLLEPRKQYRRLDKLAAALEKLLLVTSTCPRSPNPGPRPALSDLGPVNDNPPSPYVTSPPAGAGASAGTQQLLQQQQGQQLPNGQEVSVAAGGGASPHGSGSGRNSAVFRMFMHSQGPVGPASPSSAGGGSPGGEARGAQPAEGSPGGSGTMSEEDAAEAELAKRFVEDALRTDPDSASQEQQQGAHAAPVTLAAAPPPAAPAATPSLVPHMPQPQRQQPEGEQGRASPAGGGPRSAAGPAWETGNAAAGLGPQGQQQGAQAQAGQAVGEQAAAAMDIDDAPGPGLRQAEPALKRGPGAPAEAGTEGLLGAEHMRGGGT